MLTAKQRKHLKSLAHHLEPVVRVGQHGLTPAVAAETGRALDAHELIKVRIDADGDQRTLLAEELAAQTSSEVAGSIGKITMLYRARAEKPEIKLPK
jgi:RNA-binding protein